ncbi:hypothetical protein D3C81_1437520 [compost metagenome]
MELHIAGAHDDFLRDAQAIEFAAHEGIDAALLVLEIGGEVAVHGTAAIGLDGAGHALVGRIGAFIYAQRGRLEGPPAVEVVLEVQVDGGLFHLAAVPVGARIGRAGQSQFAAVGVARQADEHRTAAPVDVAHGQAHGGGGTEVVVERRIHGAVLAPHLVDEGMAVVFIDDGAPAQSAFRIQRRADVELRAVMVPRTGAARERDLARRQRALAHQIDGTARAARAFEQARCPA